MIFVTVNGEMPVQNLTRWDTFEVTISCTILICLGLSIIPGVNGHDTITTSGLRITDLYFFLNSVQPYKVLVDSSTFNVKLEKSIK